QGVLLCGGVPVPRALRESRIINACLTADCFKPRSGLTGLEGAIPYRLEQEEKGWSAGTKYCGTQNTSIDQRSFAGVLGHMGCESGNKGPRLRDETGRAGAAAGRAVATRSAAEAADADFALERLADHVLPLGLLIGGEYAHDLLVSFLIQLLHLL